MIRFRNAATSFIAGLIYGVFDRQRELSSALIIMFAGIIVVSIGGVSGFGVGAEILSMAALFVSIFSAVDFLISTKTRNRIRDKILEIYVRSDDAVKTADRLAVDRERKRFESIKTLSIVSLYMRDKGRRSAIAYVVMFTVICWEAFFVRNPSYWVVLGA